ncbi:phenylalanine--tRNA ligase subunit beta, partial [Ascosphaera atra]
VFATTLFGIEKYGDISGCEVVHGLLDRVMMMLKSAYVTGEEGLSNDDVAASKYWIEELTDPMYFPGHAANVHLSLAGKDYVIGQFGILHPTVLEKFELKYPVSTLEINIEKFL